MKEAVGGGRTNESNAHRSLSMNQPNDQGFGGTPSTWPQDVCQGGSTCTQEGPLRSDRSWASDRWRLQTAQHLTAPGFTGSTPQRSYHFSKLLAMALLLKTGTGGSSLGTRPTYVELTGFCTSCTSMMTCSSWRSFSLPVGRSRRIQATTDRRKPEGAR